MSFAPASAQYKPAIDGLRALAVTLVLLFHGRGAGFSGGYIGVDVFFVLSGYLITILIINEHERGGFSIADFYERRARRILPSFFLVVLTTLALGAILFLPRQLAQLGSSVVAATLFVSNFYFSGTQSYFLDETELQPLLHTWSLAVEEQFYILFPLFALAGLRLFKRHLSYAFLAAALGSFVISVYLTRTHPQAAFYVSAGRAWELLLGAWLAATAMRGLVPLRLRSTLQWIGLLMVLVAAVTYDSFTPFPGFAALLPVVGTMLLIAWSDQDSHLRRAFSHPALVRLGLISYPLYLWHWPLLVLSQQALLRELHGYEIVLLYLLAAALSVATCRFIETPVRSRRTGLSTRQLSTIAAGLAGLLVASGLAIWSSDGLHARLPADALHALAASNEFDSRRYACHNWNRTSPQGLSGCVIGASDRKEFDFAFWGDSIAGSMASAVDSAARSLDIKGLQLTAAACPPLLETHVIVRHRSTGCYDLNEAALHLFRHYGIRNVIIEAEWEWYADGEGIGFGTSWPAELRLNGSAQRADDGPSVLQQALRATIERLQSAGINVTVLGPIPVIGWNVSEVLAALEWRKSPLPNGPTFDNFLDQQKTVFPIMKVLERDGTRVVYPHGYLCGPTCFIRLNDQILYRDGEHLTTRGAELLRPMFTQILSKLAERP